jgi:anti-sigma B factor antagonist
VRAVPDVTPFEVRVRDAAPLLVVALEGELDMLSAPQVAEALSRAGGEHRAVVIDLSQLTFVDSSGLNVLLVAYRRSQQAPWRVSLVPGPERVQRTLEISAMDRLFPLVDRPEQALDSGA